MARKAKAPRDLPRVDFRDQIERGGDDSSWWLKEMPEGRDRGSVMVEVARQVETSPAELLRQDLNILHASLYEGVGLSSLYQYGGKATLTQVAAGAGLQTMGDVTWNQIRSVVQTVTSQVARSKP